MVSTKEVRNTLNRDARQKLTTSSSRICLIFDSAVVRLVLSLNEELLEVYELLTWVTAVFEEKFKVGVKLDLHVGCHSVVKII